MKGLNTNFDLQKGRFLLSDGVEKVRDEIKFLLTFDKFRVYLLDYGEYLVYLCQKPVSYLQTNGNLLTRVIRSRIEKYVPTAKINRVDIGYVNNNRQQVNILINYEAIQDDKTTIEDVIFV